MTIRISFTSCNLALLGYSIPFSIPRLCMLLFFFQYSQALHATLFLSIFPGSACYSFSFNIPRLCMLLFFFQYSQALHATLFLSIFPGSVPLSGGAFWICNKKQTNRCCCLCALWSQQSCFLSTGSYSCPSGAGWPPQWAHCSPHCQPDGQPTVAGRTSHYLEIASPV